MSDTCSHQTIAEWTALYAERDRLERLWKSAEVQAEQSGDAYVAAVEQLRRAVGALERIATGNTPAAPHSEPWAQSVARVALDSLATDGQPAALALPRTDAPKGTT